MCVSARGRRKAARADYYSAARSSTKRKVNTSAALTPLHRRCKPRPTSARALDHLSPQAAALAFSTKPRRRARPFATLASVLRTPHPRSGSLIHSTPTRGRTHFPPCLSDPGACDGNPLSPLLRSLPPFLAPSLAPRSPSRSILPPRIHCSARSLAAPGEAARSHLVRAGQDMR